MASKNNKVKSNKTYFKDFKAELKRVVWPTSKQLLNNTIGVVVIVIIVTAIVFVLDIGFEAMNKYGVNRLKGVVNSTSVSENLTNETENTTNTENLTNGIANTTDNEVTNSSVVENNVTE